jgi:restriction system protein
MAAENAVGGYVVTSGKFTRDAIAFAEGKNITLIDGNRLEEILDSTETIKTKDANKESKACPRCGSKLVERNGRKGKFSGCNSYPKCRYTEDLTLEK